MSDPPVYLDWAGAARFTREHLASVLEDLSTNEYSNPHSSAKTVEAIQQIRFRILELFNTSFQEYSVVFTSGCTGALKLLAESFDFHKCAICAQPHKQLDDLYLNNKSDLVRPAFVYLRDNHTSVVGMREISQNASIYCVTEEELLKPSESQKLCECRSLFVYPGMSNFCGRKYPLDWIQLVQNGQLGDGRWYVCLDAAALVSTTPLDLSSCKPDFVTLSFYKIFGYPTGIGALLVRNRSANVLRKRYFGGGTVLVSLPSQNYFMPRPNLSERMEDGTVPFLQIVSLKHGFNVIEQAGGLRQISDKVFCLAQYVFQQLSSYKHSSGGSVAKIYCSSDFSNPSIQGGIVNFNLLRSDGSFVGYSEVEKVLELHNVLVRTGCFCNQGACQHYLNLSDHQLLQNYKAGKTCGDHIDLIDGKPVGSIRVSFGYLSTIDDADRFLDVIKNCFIDQVNDINRLDSKGTDDHMCIHTATVLDVDATEPHISEIFIYPVKSCGYFKVDSWPLCPTGFLYDRTFMIVNSGGTALTQKREPKMCRIRPTINLSAHRLTLHSDASKDVADVNIEANCDVYPAKHCQTKVCQDNVMVADCGDQSAQFIDSILNSRGCRLVRQLSITPREIMGDKQLSLANEGQFLLVSRSSAEELLRVIVSHSWIRLTVDDLLYRFRPNLIVSNIPAFVEDTWQSVTIGEHTFEVTGRCTRCQMICVDQLSGEKSVEILMGLKKLRDNEVSSNWFNCSRQSSELQLSHNLNPIMS